MGRPKHAREMFLGMCTRCWEGLVMVAREGQLWEAWSNRVWWAGATGILELGHSQVPMGSNGTEWMLLGTQHIPTDGAILPGLATLTLVSVLILKEFIQKDSLVLNVVPILATSVSPENLVEMRILRPQLSPTDSETLEIRLSNLHCNKPSRKFWCSLKLGISTMDQST